MTPRTRAPYYGWVVLFVAATAMVGTLPGRTQGLGLVTEPLLADLNIGRVDYAQLNLWATLIGASGAIGIGRFLDRFGSRAVLTIVAGGARHHRGADEPRHDILRTRHCRHADARARTERALGREHRHGRSLVRAAHRHGDGDLQRGTEHRVHDCVSGCRIAGPVARLARRVVRGRRRHSGGAGAAGDAPRAAQSRIDRHRGGRRRGGRRCRRRGFRVPSSEFRFERRNREPELEPEPWNPGTEP